VYVFHSNVCILLEECYSLDYKSNEELQRWILTHLGITESENPYTGSQGAINVWQVSKLIPPEILPTIVADHDLLCNILEMKKKRRLKELNDPILSDDNDSRRFSMTSSGMLQFRKEILPMAQMLINQDQKLEQTIQSSKADSNTKKGFVEKLKEFKDKFQDKLEDEAINFLINTAKPKAIPILIELMRLPH
jgi:hypothetical protein